MIPAKRHRIVSANAPGAPLNVVDAPTQPPGTGQVLVKVAAAALNFADLLALKERYQEKTTWPHVPGMEFTGTIVATGDGVPEAFIGRRAVCYPGRGGLGDYATCPITKLVLLDDRVDFAGAAAIPIAYGTSHLALTRCSNLKPGESLAVLGASGGVGLTAVEIGKRLGARVIACARGARKTAVAAQAGADEVIDTDATDDLREALRQRGGVDVVYDAVGGELGLSAFSALRPGGHFLVIGFAGGPPPALPLNHALVKNITISGFYWGGLMSIDPDAVRTSLETVFRWYSNGEIKPHISARYPLKQGAEALAFLASRKATGKVIVEP